MPAYQPFQFVHQRLAAEASDDPSPRVHDAREHPPRRRQLHEGGAASRCVDSGTKLSLSSCCISNGATVSVFAPDTIRPPASWRSKPAAPLAPPGRPDRPQSSKKKAFSCASVAAAPSVGGGVNPQRLPRAVRPPSADGQGPSRGGGSGCARRPGHSADGKESSRSCGGGSIRRAGDSEPIRPRFADMDEEEAGMRYSAERDAVKRAETERAAKWAAVAASKRIVDDHELRCVPKSVTC